MLRMTLAALAVFLLARPGMSGDKEKPADETLQKAKKQVLAHLGEAPARQVEAVADKFVRQVLPNHVVVIVGFPQWPVAVSPPAPLKSRNLFLVPKEGKLEQVTDAKGLEIFFKKQVSPKLGHETVARAWLRLSQEFVQDGFYKFKIPDQFTVLAGSSLTIISGTAEVVPEGGNKGHIKATLRFDRDNNLATVQEEIKVVRGIRPRCQAKLLVHPDPVIRAIAEDDLRVLGKAAQPYLLQQRAGASPDLRQAIDRLWQRIVAEDK